MKSYIKVRVRAVSAIRDTFIMSGGIGVGMKETDLICSTCSTQLDTAFLGKANARGWEDHTLVCPTHSDSGNHVVPTES